MSFIYFKCTNYNIRTTYKEREEKSVRDFFLYFLNILLYAYAIYYIYKMFSYSYIIFNFFYSRSLTSQIKNDFIYNYIKVN